MTSRRCLVAATLGALVLLAARAEARPGGGSSFSTGDSSSASSSDSALKSTSSPDHSITAPAKPLPDPLATPHHAPRPIDLAARTTSAPTPRPRLVQHDKPGEKWTWVPGGGPLFTPPPLSVERDFDDLTVNCDPIFAADEVEPRSGKQPLTDHFKPILLLLVALGYAVYVARDVPLKKFGWSTRTAGPGDPEQRPAHRHLDEIRDHDPDFSRVLFEDFLHHLHAQAHISRGDPELRAAVRPYLREPARRTLAQLGEVEVSGVLVGRLHVVACARVGKRWQVIVRLDTSCTESPDDGPARTCYSVERWTLSRRIDLRSRPPERVRSLGCPNCGAPVRAILGATCAHCDQPVDSGEFDWIVDRIVIDEREQRPPDLLGDTVDARSELDTLYDPHARVAWKQLIRKDPTFSATVLSQRVNHIFRTMHHAWSTSQWDDARPLLSDALHHARAYWIAAYRAAGLRNVSEPADITNLEVVRCTSDRWYDAITVRIHATGLDYTVDATGEVLRGSTTTPRPYSEYWTLIRGRAVERDDAACPQCAASLALTMAGDCGRCGAHLTTAAFDWVLSRIEPDEAYRG